MHSKKKMIIVLSIIIIMVFMINSVAFAESYKLIATADPVEGGSVSGAGEYQSGQNAVLKAEPNSGYTFEGWFREDGKTIVTKEQELEYDLEISRSYIARFEKALTVGAIAEPADGGRVEGGGEFLLNQDSTITAISNDGFAFLGWFDASSPAVALSTDSTYEFKVSQPTSLIARFASLYRLDVNVVPQEGGSVQGAGKFAGGSIVMLEAMPNKDYRFEGWVSPANPQELIRTDEKYTRNLDSDLTLTAKFGWSYEYIWTRVLIFGAIGIGVAFGVLVLIRHVNTVRRRAGRTGRTGRQPTNTIYNNKHQDKNTRNKKR